MKYSSCMLSWSSGRVASDASSVAKAYFDLVVSRVADCGVDLVSAVVGPPATCLTSASLWWP